jgi:hypothetical protein
MAEIGDLSTLICGGDAVLERAPDCEISHILTHLKSVLNTNLAELKWLEEQPASKIALYGPFLIRSLLEVGVTALVGRMDPTRLLVIKRTQQHGEYDTKQPWNSAIRWQGDVVDKKVTDLWAPDKHYKDMTKALFGDYYVEIYWAVALRKLADSDHAGGAWLASIKGKEIGEFAATRRDTATKLYSESSKGVHSEFVIPPGSRYDRLTVTELLAKTMQLLAELGLLMNLLPHIPYRSDAAEAIARFNAAEELEIMQ